MKKIKSIQLKAAFLLIGFSMNTIIGFACAMNMEFNSHHHEKSVSQRFSHCHSPLEHNDVAVKDHHPSKDQHNCCHDKVAQISKLNKAIPQSFSTSVNFIFISKFASSFYNINLHASLRNTDIRYFVRSPYWVVPDIRIAIQSFQI